MSLDYISIISSEASRIADAYEEDRKAAVPWSDRWTVATVARHVAGTHHVVAQVVGGRPDADFGLFAALDTPAKDAPEFIEWFRSGTAALVDQLSGAPGDAECWSWYALGRSVDWWARRMAQETVVHRTDAESALGKAASIAPDVAADGVDEYLDVFVAASRAVNAAPAGPIVGFECSDRDERWSLDLAEAGQRVVSRGASDGSVTVSGTAEGLLLFLWGRAADVDISGELSNWTALVPPM